MLMGGNGALLLAPTCGAPGLHPMASRRRHTSWSYRALLLVAALAILGSGLWHRHRVEAATKRPQRALPTASVAPAQPELPRVPATSASNPAAPAGNELAAPATLPPTTTALAPSGRAATGTGLRRAKMPSAQARTGAPASASSAAAAVSVASEDAVDGGAPVNQAAAASNPCGGQAGDQKPAASSSAPKVCVTHIDLNSALP